MDEVRVKEEVPMDVVENGYDDGPSTLMYGVTVKEEPEDFSSLDAAPYDEITIKPEKIEPYITSDDNGPDTDTDAVPIPITPIKTLANDGSKKRSSENTKNSSYVSSISTGDRKTAAVSSHSNDDEKCVAGSISSPGMNEDEVVSSNFESASKSIELSGSEQPHLVLDNVPEASPSDFLCNVVADLTAPSLGDYIMMPMVMEDNDGGHSFEMEMSELDSSWNESELPTDNSGSSCSKTRTADPTRWVSVAAKKARNLGEEYVSPDGSIVVKARKMGPGCGFSCRYKCHDKLSEIHRQEIFSQFWKMGTHSLHWDFISKHVKVMKKKTSTSSSDSRRQTSRIYYFRVNNEEIQVCKTMFTHTLGVWDQWIETAIRKSQTSDGVAFPDMRGKHTTNASRIYGANAATKASVIDHIKMFKPVESRDISKKSEKQYLEEGLSVSSMHKLYLEWIADRQVKPATLRQYRDMFNANFNLSFFVPKKECHDCNIYKNASPQDKLSLEQCYQEHLKRKTQIKELKTADAQEAKTKGNSHIGMVCFDLEKVLCTPQCRNPLAYYKHKLSVSNVTVCDVGAHAGYCYVWHEFIARRTSNEIASILLHYIEMKKADGVTEFRIYCDDGYGLNKNESIMAVLTLAAAKFGVKIRLRYLLRGHSHNETDNMQNLIEKRGKDYELYVPDDWIKVMESAKNWRNPQGEASKPYSVIEVSQNMIYNLSDLAEKLNFDVDENGLEIPWSKVSEISFDDSEPGCFTYKCEFVDQPSKVRTEMAGRKVDLNAFSLATAYSGHLPIAQSKLDDLLSLCSGTVVPSRYHQFYRSLKGCFDIDQPECVRDIEPKVGENPESTEEHSSDSEEPPVKKAVK